MLSLWNLTATYRCRNPQRFVKLLKGPTATLFLYFRRLIGISRADHSVLYELSGSAADSKDIRSAEVKSGPGITPIYFGTHSKAVKITIKSVKGNQTAIQYHKGSNCLAVNPSGQMPFSQCVKKTSVLVLRAPFLQPKGSWILHFRLTQCDTLSFQPVGDSEVLITQWDQHIDCDDAWDLVYSWQ